MITSFTISDLLSTSVAFFLFALVIFVPGYVFGWLVDVFGFRGRSLLARLAISVPMSVGVCPILTYLLWHWSIVSVWMLYTACWITFLALLIQERNIWFSRPPISRRIAIVFAIVAGWVALELVCLVDLEIGHRLYYPTAGYDYTLRTAITAAINRTGIPPHNPYFFPGRPFALRYHYFWFMLCSLVDQLGGSLISPRQAMLAGTLWCSIGLFALVPLYLRFFQPKGPVNLDRRMLVGIALLSVTGLDIVPVAFVTLFSGRVFATIEWWNEQVSAWVTAALWVPHHVASLTACLTGFLIAWSVSHNDSVRKRIFAGAIAGLTFASATGLSIYVSFVFAVFLAIWLGITAFRKNHRDAVVILIAGLVALAVSSPYLLELKGGPSVQNAGGPVLQFAIRPFRVAEAIVQSFWPGRPWLVSAMNLLSLPVNYFLELGLFFLVGAMQWRKMSHRAGGFNQSELCGLTMAATSILICTFVRSSVISNNDLGRRGFLVAQFILLIWATELWDEGQLPPPVNRQASSMNLSPLKSRGAIMALITLGVAGSIYEVCMVRFYPLLSDDLAITRYDWLSPDQNLGKRTYALRQVYEVLKNKLPVDAIVQHNPNSVPGDMFYGLYADRQAAAETSQCGVVFGGDPALCPAVVGPLNNLFASDGTVGADGVDVICKDLLIDALVAKDTDKAWADKSSWVWKKQPVIANNYARAFLCGRRVNPDIR